MSEKFHNKYRIPSARASWWNYANPGAYFITICTHGRDCIFGIAETHGGASPCGIALSPIGKIVEQEWNKSFKIRTELFCDAFVIMPNHIHAILRIEPSSATTEPGVETDGRASQRTEPKTGNVETDGRPSLRMEIPTGDDETHGRPSLAHRTPKSISSFVAGFKSAATTRINQYRNTPKKTVWQTRFHDHIIRNDTEYRLIREYIKNNPANWVKDKWHK
ncbi:MAG: transposase [Bacteroidota bacterium]